MNELIYYGVMAFELFAIIFLGTCFYISLLIRDELKAENDDLRNDNQSLKKEIAFEKKVSKTFSDGLEALKLFQKN